MKRKIKVQLQLDITDCGPACLSSIVKYYNGNVPIDRIRELSGKSRNGTTLLGLYQAANSIGFTAKGCKASVDSLIAHGKPSILHVLLENKLEHYVVFYRYSRGFFYVGDPGFGLIKLSKDELESMWISKMCLILEPNSSFIIAKEERSQKIRSIHSFIKPELSVIYTSILVGIIISILGLATAVFSQKLIDDILPSNDLKKIYISITLLATIQLFRVFFSSIRSRLLIEQGKSFNERIFTKFFKDVLSIKMSFFDTRKVGDIVTRLQDTRRIQGVVAQVVGGSIIDLLVVVVSIGALFYYLPVVGIISIVGLPIYFFIILYSNKKIIEKQHMLMSSFSSVESSFIKSVEGMSTIKTNCLEERELFQNQKSYSDYLNNFVDLGILNISIGLKTGIIGILLMSIIIGVATYNIRLNVIEVGSLVAIISIASSTFPAIANIALFVIPLNEAKVAYERIHEITTYPVEVNDGVNCPTIIECVNFDGISFRYPGARLLINEVSFCLQKGKIYGLSGKSGSGKSTICHLIERFYSPEKGIIYIGNLPLNDISLKEWRQSISTVPQEIHLFNGSLIYNICLTQSNDERESVVDYLKTIGLNHFFESFPNGYDTLVGDCGVNLSGGQKQLLALARALYRKPKLLILDEATSAMDEVSEREVLNTLNTIKSDMIILVISHKRTLISEVDEFFKLESGNLIIVRTGASNCIES